MLEAAIFAIFPFCMVFAAVSDLISMTIANRVMLILVGAFAVLAPLTGMDWQVYGMHFAAFAGVLCVTFALFAVGGMGGGDAKLLAATALWLGPSLALMDYMLLSAMYGGALTLAILMFRRSPVADVTCNNLFLRNLADRTVGIPYGIALGIAGLSAFPQSALAAWALQRMTAG